MSKKLVNFLCTTDLSSVFLHKKHHLPTKQQNLPKKKRFGQVLTFVISDGSFVFPSEHQRFLRCLFGRKRIHPAGNGLQYFEFDLIANTAIVCHQLDLAIGKTGLRQRFSARAGL